MSYLHTQKKAIFFAIAAGGESLLQAAAAGPKILPARVQHPVPGLRGGFAAVVHLEKYRRAKVFCAKGRGKVWFPIWKNICLACGTRSFQIILGKVSLDAAPKSHVHLPLLPDYASTLGPG